MRDTHVDNLVDAYALGALEPEEVDEVERHLEGCPDCRALAEAARKTAEQFLYVAPQVAPPSTLKGKLMRRIAAEKAASTRTPREAAPAAAEAHEAHEALEPQMTPAPAGRLRRAMRTLFTGGTLEEQSADVLRGLLAEPDCLIWPVAGTDDAPGASARLVGSRTRREAVLVANGLRQSAPGQAYQVWFLRGGQPVPNALFQVNTSGQGTSVVRVQQPLAEFDTVAVTPEPESGSPGPTGPIVLAGSLVVPGR